MSGKRYASVLPLPAWSMTATCRMSRLSSSGYASACPASGRAGRRQGARVSGRAIAWMARLVAHAGLPARTQAPARVPITRTCDLVAVSLHMQESPRASRRHHLRARADRLESRPVKERALVAVALAHNRQRRRRRRRRRARQHSRHRGGGGQLRVMAFFGGPAATPVLRRPAAVCTASASAAAASPAATAAPPSNARAPPSILIGTDRRKISITLYTARRVQEQ
eukprot:352281-Chlamydomonas_euryale.AAC.5